MNHIAIFSSGSGSNAENISNFFFNHSNTRVSCILTNKSDAYVIERALRLKIPCYVFSRADLYDSEEVLTILKKHDISHVVLAGFLWIIPSALIRNYPGLILNIHPALLPKFGGKGMYGQAVHRAVLAQGCNQTGITIHEVNDQYDEGAILFQATCAVLPEDTVDSLTQRVHELEYRHYPETIAGWIEEKQKQLP